MVKFSAGLQTRQEERYVFCLILGGRCNIRRRSLALAGPPISAENRGDALIRDRWLNQANTVFIPME